MRVLQIPTVLAVRGEKLAPDVLLWMETELPMIFGFNSDVRVEETIYHVQTELREMDGRLESQVFVSGRCIGKRSRELPPDSGEAAAQELARAQHRWVVEAVRGGFVDDVIGQESDEELVVQFLGSERRASNEVVLRFRVLCGGFIAPQAQLWARWRNAPTGGIRQSTFSNESGVAEMIFVLPEGEAELEVMALLQARETTRRFLIRAARR